MAAFRDHTGHDWRVSISVGHLKPLRERFGIDLKASIPRGTGAKDGLASMADLIADPERLYEVLLYLCEGQVRERGLDAEAFAYVLCGQAIRDSAAALAEAAFELFHGPESAKKVGSALRETMQAADAYATSVVQKAMAEFNAQGD
jgi:hypothetical protein